MQSIENKVALITGGSKGIGFGIAQSMLDEGMKVAITSRSQQAADQAAEKLSKTGKGKVLGLEADVRDLNAQQKVIDKIIDEWGKLDVLIANAGVGHFGSIEDLSTELWNETIDINLTGVYNSIKVAVPSLKQTKGYIITIASLAGTNFFAGGFAYNASKFGLVGFTQAVMLDLRNYGIRVSTLMPGSVSSHFNSHDPSSDDAWKIQPEDLGQMIVDLLKINPRTLPSKIEVRPTTPPKK